MAKKTVAFTFDDRDYPELARWLAGLPKGGKSEAIRDALQAQLAARTALTLEDVYQAVRELDRKLARGVVLAGNADDQGAGDPADDEPPDVAAALDSLGL